MLWTDGIFITPTDLTRIDSEVVTVASNNDITLTGTNGLIRGAIEEASFELMKYAIAFGGYLNSGDLTSNHYAAVLNVGIGNSVRQKCVLGQVCISGDVAGGWNWIKSWAVFWTLRSLYRDAFSRTVNDRFEKKASYFKEEMNRRLNGNLMGMGLPIVLRPLPAPGATFERDAGSWDETNVTQVNGAGTLTTAQSVAITFVDMSQANLYLSSAQPNNAESSPSETITQTMLSGKVLKADITSLIPPTGTQHPSQVLVCVISPLTATHWNVYAGVSGGTLYLQNASPIPIATKTYTLAADPTTTTGVRLGIGQYPNRRLSILPTRQRG